VHIYAVVVLDMGFREGGEQGILVMVAWANKYALSEDMEQTDWISMVIIFLVYCIIGMKIVIYFYVFIHPFPPNPSNYS
jgi:hypothetical protein